ncbi:hypothetical protein WA026_010516 [Henosepilachna vigintioctopunctata]|uniref:RUN domain-containing protein n=1 Tax=Henosepilachna vigintioctopunctata TaxID=420089 RepID=A0AAW1V434_9CUCU
MNRLLKTVRINNTRDEMIKKSIIDQLSNSVKELQYSGVEEYGSNIIDSTEAANQLCIIVEAIFLHGLKDSLTHRFRRAVADVDARPEPSFWAPLLIISHRQIIDHITNLSQITTETGQCRAWIRQALNDCLLSSYMSTLRQDSSSLKNYYKVGAFIRDVELLDVAETLIAGFEGFKSVTLPCNSSLLNTWPHSSLYLAGIWAPTLKTCPLAPCDDIVQSMEAATLQKISDNISETNSLSSAMSVTSQSSAFQRMMAFNEDDVIKMILTKNEDKSYESDSDKSKKNLMTVPEPSTEKSEVEKVEYSVGNSLSRVTGWSFDDSAENEVSQPVAESPPKEVAVKDFENPKPPDDSFNALIDSYNVLYGDYIRTPNLREVWQKIDEMHMNVADEVPATNLNKNKTEEVVPNVVALKNESKALSEQLGEICREKGLDKQNFECLGCKTPFVVDQKLNVCAFTGEYYCDNCMSNETTPIPARIIHNWDFNYYHVSQRSFNYINEVKDHPLIDFKVLNPFIYSIVQEMSELQTLRNQLNYLRAYLYTCREPIIGELQKLLYPREYMYEHVHRYSINDLSEITNRVLAQFLQRGVDFGREHVNTCWLCSQKGFVCEICETPKTIFPFDVDNVYRCNDCNAVYHKHCLTKHKPCPKCKRRKEREDLSLLGATVDM